jgi:hypothetical protein
MQFAVDDFPAWQFGKQDLNFGVGQFLCGHDMVLQGRSVDRGTIMSRAP